MTDEQFDDGMAKLTAAVRRFAYRSQVPGIKTSEMQLSTAIGSALLFAEEIGLELTDVQVVAIAAVAAVYAVCRTAAKIAATFKG